MSFTAAGILFQDKTSGKYLSGWNPKLQAWSGFGGKRKGNETAWETALREVVEELYGISLPAVSLETLQHALSPMEFYTNKFYVFFVMPLDFVFKLGEMLDLIEYKSPFYKKYPRTLNELFESRTTENVPYVELTDISLVAPTFSGPVDAFFKADIRMISGDSDSD